MSNEGKKSNKDTSELNVEDTMHAKVEELLACEADGERLDLVLLKEVLLGLNTRISRLEAWKQRHEENGR